MVWSLTLQANRPAPLAVPCLSGRCSKPVDEERSLLSVEAQTQMHARIGIASLCDKYC